MTAYTEEVLQRVRDNLAREYPDPSLVLQPGAFLESLNATAYRGCVQPSRWYYPRILPLIGRGAAKYPELAIRQWSGTVGEALAILDQVLLALPTPPCYGP